MAEFMKRDHEKVMRIPGRGTVDPDITLIAGAWKRCHSKRIESWRPRVKRASSDSNVRKGPKETAELRTGIEDLDELKVRHSRPGCERAANRRGVVERSKSREVGSTSWKEVSESLRPPPAMLQ